MSKKRNRKKLPTATGVVWRQSAEEATLASKPLYNGFACGHGAHGSKKYQRSKVKQAWRKQLRQEGAPRGSFLFGKRPALQGAGGTGRLMEVLA